VPVAEKKKLVGEVFSSVARQYDLMNDLMSLGIHRLWKRVFVSDLDPRPNHQLLDLAGGTGDITFGWLRRGGGKAILSDINAAMLGVGRDRAVNNGRVADITFVVADAERLPLPDRCMDRVSIAFGLRNCTNKDAVLAEARRVLKPGGRFLCLEFSRPTAGPVRKLYDAWSFHAIPRIGGWVAKDRDSYQYLVESIRRFPDQTAFKTLIEEAGFKRVSVTNLSGGIAAIHHGWAI
jgi:demethylmenaquinone methyltransferase/2-methoxy-6-polyprenyl-1,4-benzoquinol methylase